MSKKKNESTEEVKEVIEPVENTENETEPVENEVVENVEPTTTESTEEVKPTEEVFHTLKVEVKFTDKYTKEKYKVGKEITVTAERAKELLSNPNGLVSEVK